MYRYEFTSTLEDLLDAEKAERTVRVGRLFFRMLAILIGVGWLVSGFVAIGQSQLGWKPVMWLIFGCGILYYFIIWPGRRRARIKRNNAPEKNVSVEFRDMCIRLHVDGQGEYVRRWDELVDVFVARKGVAFVFDDGVVNWLPNRVFHDDDERRRLIEFVLDRRKQCERLQG